MGRKKVNMVNPNLIAKVRRASKLAREDEVAKINSALSDKLTMTAPKTQVALSDVTEAARAKLAEERARKKQEEEMERKARIREQKEKINNIATGRDAKALDDDVEAKRAALAAQRAATEAARERAYD